MDYIHSRKELESLFWLATVRMLGLQEEDGSASQRIRIAWPTYNQAGDAPAFKRNEDICFLRLTQQDHLFNRLSDVKYRLIEGDYGHVLRMIQYTRIHDVMWVFYGPSSYDDAQTVRDCLFRPDVKLLFNQNRLYPVPDLPAPVRIPELYQGAWWERTDFRASCNEAVRREFVVPVIKRVPLGSGIHILTEKGEVEYIEHPFS